MIRLSSSDFIGVATNQPISADEQYIHVYGAGDVTVKFTNDRRILGENVGAGDGATVTFTLANIPVTVDTEVVYVNGEAQIIDTDYTIDYATGVITFAIAPDLETLITADYIGTVTVNKTVTAAVGDEITPSNGAVDVTSVGTIGIHSL